ncbi:hypothetical protein V5F77_04400 [Xanthobacter sp. DSM 24535]|uniref:non-contractile tail sheath protein n=1 Tax=Roseixanthobacter psychrophilus TaxID=3119917 RepID=UPI003728AC9E
MRTIRRFEPAYWTIDHPLTASASVTTLGPDGLRLSAQLRTKADIVGLKWESADRWSAKSCKYLQSNNYGGCVLEFDYSLSGLPNLNDVAGLVLSVTDDAGVQYYVRLANYATSGDGYSGHIRLDFAGAPVLGGYNISDGAQRTVIPWHRITEMFLGVSAPGYNATPVPITPVDATIELTNISVSGPFSTLKVADIEVPPHKLRMCDGYDDAYNITPERLVDGIWRLGYRDWYVLYIGASHLHALVWSNEEGHLVVDDSHPISPASRLWFADLFARLTARGYRIIVSQSYEILASFCPTAWRQRDFAGVLARTGWEPPSTLIAPTNGDGMNYLRVVADWVLSAVEAVGAAPYYQIGEPWWWDGSFSDSGPCIYDPTTTALYTTETGNPVPTPYIQTTTEPIGIHADYLAFLGRKLGLSTLWLRDHARAAHPRVQVLALVFTPQVLNPGSPLITAINFPHEYWKFPAFDILQLEDYDWIATKEWELHNSTLTAGTDKLGYPLSRIHYFAGFNLLPETADYVWPSIFRAAGDGFEWGAAETCVWARPQVWRDGWIYPFGDLVAGPGADPDPGPDPVEWFFPSDLKMVANTWGDAVLSFAPNVDARLHVYDIEIMSVATAGTVLRTIRLAYPLTQGGRVVCDYPVELSAPDFGFPPTFLSWRIRVDGKESTTGIVGTVQVNNAAFVKRAIAFAGQSEALGHYTTLSGADGRRDLVSAGAFRRDVAARTGLRAVEVIPVQACWGSSAADKYADDDPVAGVNYWWDLDAGEPGPRLEEFLEIVRGLGVPINEMIWAQGENDVSAFDPAAVPRFSSPARYRAATEAIFAYIRSELDMPDLPIWWQTLARAYWGDPPDPAEPTGAFYKTARDIQISISAADPNIMIGSWVPGAEAISGYVPEVGNPGWIHYTSAVYHATAAELSEAIAHHIDRIGSPPAWTLLEAPTGLAAEHSGVGSDIAITWDDAPSTMWRIKNISVETGDLLHVENINDPNWTFTTADQLSAYGAPAGFVNVELAIAVPGAFGPAATLVTAIGSAPAPTGLSAIRDPANADILIAWDDVVDATWTVQNYSVIDSSLLSEVTASDPTWTFTEAAQIAAYGALAGYVSVKVAQPGGVFAALVESTPAHGAPTGLAASKDGTTGDITATWDAVAGAVWTVRNRSVATAEIISEIDVTVTTWVFTAAQQIAAYGFQTGNLYVEVVRHGGSTATYFDAVPTA